MMSLPSGYTQVEYIESGSLQYIDTGFYPNQDTRVVWKAYNNSSSSAWIYGARKTSSSGLFGAMIGNGFVYGTQTATVDMTAIGAMEIDQNKNEYRYNEVAGSLSKQTFSSDFPMYLFACNGSGEATSLRFNGKLYSCKIYDGETLARDYVPCKNPSGLVGLYDLVNGTFCTQAAGGAFISGPEVIIHRGIDFSTLQGLTIPEGVVTQIADASGRVIWAVSGGKVVLEVAKITSDTYAGETTYTGEEFILLDIYPKTNGTVSVTYGGLTKTITDTSGAAEPNAQQVFFGTFNGVSDSVATPASGTLTIEGDYYAFACSLYQYDEKMSYLCACVVKILEFGKIDNIPGTAFGTLLESTNVTTHKLTGEIIIPSTTKSIGDMAFIGCDITSVTFGNGVTSIGPSAFNNCKLTSVTIPNSVTSIGNGAFSQCADLTSVTFDITSGWYVTETKGGDISTGTAVDVSDPANNATLITDTYRAYYWYRA